MSADKLGTACAAGALLLALLACKKEEQPETTTVAETTQAETTTQAGSDGVPEIGDRVKAPWSRSRRLYQGTVREVYGKLAFIKFDDNDEGWALVTELVPAGKPAPTPADSNAFSVGDRVSAPWSVSKRMYNGKVAETYGKLIKVNFDDGDVGWVEASRSKKL